KLTEVVSDLTGQTARAILKAILQGERDPRKLAALRDWRCQRDEATIALALQGTWRPEHLLELRHALELYEYYHAKIRECDEAIEAHLKGMALPEQEPLPPRPRKRKRQDNEPTFDARQRLYQLAGVDLTAIEGIEERTALVVLSEVGTDMSRWPTERH